VIAEGNISNDSTYHGLINFYDTSSGKLVSSAYYNNGNQHGRRTDYYWSGRIKSISFYENGRQNGILSYYDSLGIIAIKEHYYYDIPAGGVSKYRNDSLTEYSFRSLENQELFYLNYDSIFNQDMTKIDNSYFFFYSYNGTKVSSFNKELKGKEYFIYLLILQN
jgi:antitoxin component YwqK of YwqJK toxin-antitoxin module